MPERGKSRGESGVYFGSHRLDLLSGQLWRGKQEVKVAGKVFAVLRYFIEHPGQLVSKDDLFAAVWPDTVVSDATLASCIQDLRQSLGDKVKKPRYIETVHGRGYRFIASVAAVAAPVSSSRFQVPSQEEGVGREENQKSKGKNQKAKGEETEAEVGRETEHTSLPDDGLLAQDLGFTPQGFDSLAPNTQHLAPPPPAVSRLWPSKSFVLAAVLLLTATILTVQYLSRPSLSTQDSALRTRELQLPLPDKPSLIVLPLVNLSGDPGQDYFSDGLTDVLTGSLSRISGLFIIARNSAFTYKGKSVKVQEVSKEMGVRYVLEGSVQKAEQRVRIVVQLIDATTGYQVWSQQYDRPLTDLFALQDEVVQKIVTTLQLQLTLEERGGLVRKHTNNLEAYDNFLRGEGYQVYITQEANAQARHMYEQAIALDPQYAEAYTQLGFSYWQEWVLRWTTDPQTLERALALAQQAAALNDSLPGAHSLLSYVYSVQQQYDQSIMEGERALALDPNNADSYSNQSEVLSLAGKPEAALRAAEKAIRLNPHSPPQYFYELAQAHRLAGRYTEAIATMQEVSRQSPNNIIAHLNLAVSYVLQWYSQQSPAGQTLEPALTEVQRALALSESLYWSHMVASNVYLFQHQYDQALAEIERVVALAPTEALGHAQLAGVLSCMGRTEEALASVDQALRLKASFADIHLGDVGAAYAMAGRYEEARVFLLRFLSHYPDVLPVHLTLAVVYSELGQEAEAQAEAAEVLRINPKFSLEVHRQRAPVKDPALVERSIVVLRKAGLK